jgi:exodeoxyribonuclease VII large subunit
MTLEDQPLTGEEIYSITRLNREARTILEGSFPPLLIQGELSNLARPASGHLYFSLKDNAAQVRCAMFRPRNRLLRFAPENGMQVLARAQVSLFEGRGEFQLIVEALEPYGAGAMQRAFDEIKRRLFEEGLFDAAHKQELPEYPRAIGVITSPTGAAVRDIIHVLRRRYPLARLVIYPSTVQGEGAAVQLIAAVELAERRAEVDVLILARGGGSLEDLWCFNDERLARAIHRCQIPLISGVGHEIDFTIADFVADLRAPTPSAAAELATPDAAELLATAQAARQKLQAWIGYRLHHCRQDVTQLEKRLTHPRRILQDRGQRLDNLASRARQILRVLLAGKNSALLVQRLQLEQMNPTRMLETRREKCAALRERLAHSAALRLAGVRSRLDTQTATLRAVSPQATLDRGYAIVTRLCDDTILRDAALLTEGEALETRVAKGAFQSTVTRRGPDDERGA